MCKVDKIKHSRHADSWKFLFLSQSSTYMIEVISKGKESLFLFHQLCSQNIVFNFRLIDLDISNSTAVAASIIFTTTAPNLDKNLLLQLST